MSNNQCKVSIKKLAGAALLTSAMVSASALAASNPAVPPYDMLFFSSPNKGSSSQAGFYFKPSNQAAKKPALIANTAGALQSPIIGLKQTWYDSSGQAYARTTAADLYIDSTNGHLYRLDLSATAAPSPIQMGSSVVSGRIFTDRQDLYDLSSSFAILTGEVGSPKSQILIHYTDAATATPVVLPLAPFPNDYNPLPIVCFHDAQGHLNGILALDVSGHLNLYPDLSFSKAIALLPGTVLSSFVPLYSTNTYTFVQAISSNGSATLLRIDSAGHISSALYAFKGVALANSALADPSGTRLAVFDNWQNGITAQDSVVTVPMDGSAAAKTLYAWTGGSTTSGTATLGSLNPVGFAGSSLVFKLDGWNYVNGEFTNRSGALFTAPISAGAAGPVTTIATQASGYYDQANVSGSQIFANVYTVDASDMPTGVSVGIFRSDGSVVKTFDKSEILGTIFQPSGTLMAPGGRITNFILAKGYTATGHIVVDIFYVPDLGGATVEQLSADDLGETVFKKGFSNYVLLNGEYFNLANEGSPVSSFTTSIKSGSTLTSQYGSTIDFVHHKYTKAFAPYKAYAGSIGN